MSVQFNVFNIEWEDTCREEGYLLEEGPRFLEIYEDNADRIVASGDEEEMYYLIERWLKNETGGLPLDFEFEALG